MSEEHTVHWYCLKAKTKREHIAARILKSRTEFEVFCPRVSVIKKTVRGPKVFTEALFPGYLFCKFNLATSFRMVVHSQNVTGIVKFGNKTPHIPLQAIEKLKAAIPKGTAEIKTPAIQEGELVEIIQGCFEGESGEVTKIDPISDRVFLLIEFLGNHVEIEVPSHTIINPKPSNLGASLGLEAPSSRSL